jgi:hypothetical protein
MVLKSKLLFIIIPLVLVLGIGGAVLMGVWDTEDKEAARYSASELSPEDTQSISGSYSFSTISEYYDIPVEVLYKAFSISETLDSTLLKAKDIGRIYEPTEVEIGTEAIEAFVALYNGLTYELIDVYLPTEAVNLILEHTNGLSTDVIEYLNAHAITVIALDPSEIILVQPDESGTTGFAIKGPTTIQEVLDAGLTSAEFEEIVGNAISSTDETVKDFCLSKGLTFSDIKLALEAAINP